MSDLPRIAGCFADFRELIESQSIPVTDCGCWIWLRAVGGRYGNLRVNSVNQKAHRLSYEVFKGPIPAGMHVLHRCDTPICVNPDHLFIDTHLDNMADKEGKNRGNHAYGQRNGRYTSPDTTARADRHAARIYLGMHAGEKNGRSKLDAADVVAIRASMLPSRTLAKKYSVSKTTIIKIKSRKLWSAT